ncbi:MAG: PLP-dependent aminotransferase family protein [Acidobacteriota bacterium]
MFTPASMVEPFPQNAPFLYEQITDRISRLIEGGTLRPGERVPSVRKLSALHRVSISTVLQAYRLLESRGLIEARPQSGYFVRHRRWTPPPEPEIALPEPGAAEVEISKLVMQVVRDNQHSSLMRLGATCANPSHHPAARVHRSLASVARRCLRHEILFDPIQGVPALRVQIARRAVDAGCTLSPNEIVVTSGATEAMHCCLRAVAEPGDPIAIEAPTYFGILHLIESLGMRAVEIATYPREGVCLEALERALDRERIKACLFVLNFNNPLGSCVPDEKKKKLVSLLSRRGIPLIENDIYGDLAHTEPRPRAAKAFDQDGLVLLCDSFNKTLSRGYRVGWVAPGRFRERVEFLKFVSTDGTASVTQMAIADFLCNGGYDNHLRKLRRFYADQVRRMTKAVACHFPPGTKVTRPAGGEVLWIELARGADSMNVYRRALRKGIAIAPGTIFSVKQQYRNYIRLNCGVPWTAAVEDAVRQLGKIASDSLSRRAG